MDSTRADRKRTGRGGSWGRLGNRPRRAVVTLWTLLMLPVLLVLFAVVVEGVHLWLARVELENAMEAAALAAVKEWAAWPSGPGPGWTQPARIVGQQYAAANTILRTPVEIETNQGVFDPLTNPNENLRCEGHLIFGAITEQEPAYVFEADQAPACPGGGMPGGAMVFQGAAGGAPAAGRVMVDVTDNNLTQGDNGWGLSFPAFAGDSDHGVRIERIVIDIDPNNTGNLNFDFSSTEPVLSNSSPQPMVQGVAPDANNQLINSEQPDNFGFVGWLDQTSPSNPTVPPGTVQEWPGPGQTSPQIQFSHDGGPSGMARFLTIDFFPYLDGFGNLVDGGFEPGDRFRFGAPVQSGGSPANGDDIGAEGVTITVFFSGASAGVTTALADTQFSRRDCARRPNPGAWEQDALGNWHLLVHPVRLAPPGSHPFTARDLPCPLSNQPANDWQSIGAVFLPADVELGNFAVRAQVHHEVPCLIGSFLGIDFGGPFTVFACATAMYDCELQRPRLIRVTAENFHCPTRLPP